MTVLAILATAAIVGLVWAIAAVLAWALILGGALIERRNR